MYTPNHARLLFYRSTGAWYERLIVAATCEGDPSADFVHVAIIENSDSIIEAQWRGVVRSPLSDLSAHILIHSTLAASPAALQSALDGARAKIGWRYGIADIISQGLRLLRLPFTVGRLHSLDCSHLAAEFAAWASQDATLYGMVCDDGCIISPNDLARYYGLVEPKAHAYAKQTRTAPASPTRVG